MQSFRLLFNSSLNKVLPLHDLKSLSGRLLSLAVTEVAIRSNLVLTTIYSAKREVSVSIIIKLVIESCVSSKQTVC